MNGIFTQQSFMFAHCTDLSNCRLRDHKMTAKEAYQYFVLRAQKIAISKNWTPVNWFVLFCANEIASSIFKFTLPLDFHS